MRFHGLDEWTGAGQGLKKRAGSDLYAFDYEVTKDVTADVDGMRVAVSFRPALSHHGQRVELSERAVVEVSSLSGASLERVQRDVIYPFQNLVSLGTGAAARLDELVIVPPSMAHDRDTVVTVLFRQVGQSDRGSDDTFTKTLFPFSAIEPDFQAAVKSWLAFVLEFRPFCNMFFGSMTAPPPYLEMKLAWNLRSVAVFCRCAGLRWEPGAEVLKQLHSRLEQQASSVEKAWIEAALPWEYELALPWNLAALIESGGEIARDLVGSSDSFIKKVIVARNTVLHGEEIPRDRMARGAILWVSEAVRMLLTINTLARIEADPPLGTLLLANPRFQFLRSKLHSLD